MAGGNQPLREAVTLECEYSTGLGSPWGDAVQRPARLAVRGDPQAVVVEGQERRSDLWNLEALQHGSRRRGDPEKIEAVCPVVEPEIAAAVEPAWLRLAVGQGGKVITTGPSR